MPRAENYQVVFTREAFDDFDRLDRFLRADNPLAADASGDAIFAAVYALADNPERGARWRGAPPGLNIRQVIASYGRGYIVRYQVAGAEIRILRIFHGREDREG